MEFSATFAGTRWAKHRRCTLNLASVRSPGLSFVFIKAPS